MDTDDNPCPVNTIYPSCTHVVNSQPAITINPCLSGTTQPNPANQWLADAANQNSIDEVDPRNEAASADNDIYINTAIVTCIAYENETYNTNASASKQVQPPTTCRNLNAVVRHTVASDLVNATETRPDLAVGNPNDSNNDIQVVFSAIKLAPHPLQIRTYPRPRKPTPNSWTT